MAMRARHTRTSDSFQASFVDFETGRSIEIWATSDTTGVLIAQESWSGDTGSALAVPTASRMNPEATVRARRASGS